MNYKENDNVDDSYLWEIDTFGKTRRFIYADDERSHWSMRMVSATGKSEDLIFCLMLE